MRIIETKSYKKKVAYFDLSRCDSCEETNPMFRCPRCGGKIIENRCEECHEELVHDEISNNNIQFFREDAFKNRPYEVRQQMGKTRGG